MPFDPSSSHRASHPSSHGEERAAPISPELHFESSSSSVDEPSTLPAAVTSIAGDANASAEEVEINPSHLQQSTAPMNLNELLLRGIELMQDEQRLLIGFAPNLPSPVRRFPPPDATDASFGHPVASWGSIREILHQAIQIMHSEDTGVGQGRDTENDDYDHDDVSRLPQ
jgi:hypothetical protein